MNDRLKKLLHEKTVIFDGAIGTEIYKKNFFVNTSYESLCLNNPGVVREIHQSYRDAGAEVLTTNSFGANFNTLNKFLLGDKVQEINRAAVRIAREVAGEDLLVAASVGPVGEIPGGSAWSAERIAAILMEQIAALAMEGPDFILFESLGGARDLQAALLAMEICPDLPFVTSFALNRDAESRTGDSPARLLTILDEAPRRPEAFGLNCGIGPEGMLNALEILMPLCRLPVIAQPNAGCPKSVDNRMIYMCSPEYFTTYAMRFAALGVHGVGGCCGTGPEHIRDMARSVNPLNKAVRNTGHLAVTEEALPEKTPVPMREKSRFGAKLAAGEWVTNVEIVPPQGYLLDRTIEENGLKAYAEEEGVGLVIYSPLAQGLLTERYTHGIPADSRMRKSGSLKEEKLTPALLKKLSELRDIAEARGQTLAELALSWTLKDRVVSSVIIGASSSEQILENIKVNPDFTAEELSAIEAICKA